VYTVFDELAEGAAEDSDVDDDFVYELTFGAHDLQLAESRLPRPFPPLFSELNRMLADHLD
jgi:hypothetical protein